MLNASYRDPIFANKTSWQSTFDGIKLLQTNIIRFKDSDFIDLEQQNIKPRINWMFEPSINKYISDSQESYFVVSWSNGLQVVFDDLSQDERIKKFGEFKQREILGRLYYSLLNILVQLFLKENLKQLISSANWKNRSKI